MKFDLVTRICTPTSEQPRRLTHFARLSLLALGLLLGSPLVDASEPPKGLLDVIGTKSSVHLYEALPLKLRDGTVLSATVFVPDAPAATKHPTILIQSPYSPQMELGHGLERDIVSRLLAKGYVIAFVNVRGTQWSEGEYHWMKGARNDGLDTLDWITAQPWSDGKVGTLGCSSSGEVQLPLAMANPPALKAVVAMGAATAIGEIPGFADQGIFYMGGVPSFDWAWWYHSFGYYHHPHLPRDISQEERIALTHAFDSESQFRSEDLSWATHLPSESLLDNIGSPATEFNRLIRLAPSAPEWNEYDFVRSGQSTRVPIFHVDSWYDTIEVYGTTRLFEYLSHNSPNQYLAVGGTGHCRQGSETEQTLVGQRPVGDARFDFAGTIVHWFDHWLRDQGELNQPKVQYYSLESNHWTSASKWPLGSSARRLYLTNTSAANSAAGGGILSEHPPVRAARDSLLDNPNDPVPTLGGGCCTAMVSLDQSPVEARRDVLVYSSAPLTKPLDIAGYITVRLSLASSEPDGDLMVKLVDVYPDGRAFNITDTALRLRYRDGIEHPQLMQPNTIYTVTLGQMAIASHFAPGHRLRLEVAGTNFPEYERNLHTGGQNFDETSAKTAHLEFYHDSNHPSYVELPVTP